MQIKTKKMISGRVARMETSGEIKEILIKEDLLDAKNARIELCFRGLESSGIVEISLSEFEELQKELSSRKELFGGVKVKKFKK